jgi:hypothetical protein
MITTEAIIVDEKDDKPMPHPGAPGMDQMGY